MEKVQNDGEGQGNSEMWWPTQPLPYQALESPGQAELGEENYNSQQHLQRPQRPGFPPDRGQVAMLTGAPGADRKERKAKAVIKHSRV